MEGYIDYLIVSVEATEREFKQDLEIQRCKQIEKDFDRKLEEISRNNWSFQVCIHTREQTISPIQISDLPEFKRTIR